MLSTLFTEVAMAKTTMKPTLSKTLLFWIIMSTCVLIIIVALNWRRFSDFTSILLVTLVVLFQCLIFSLIFFNLPYFRVHIDDTTLVGPRGFGLGWQRIQIPLGLIDVQDVDRRFQWLGFYIIKSKSGGRLSLWGFSEKQVLQLLATVQGKRISAD